MNNITYYLGAGASYSALPVLNELSEEMIQFANSLIPEGFAHNFNQISIEESNPITNHSLAHFAWELKQLGMVSASFNTVDTYARKLFANGSLHKLAKLKNTLSLFLSMWQCCQKNFKTRNSEYAPEIDPRYISLIATFLNPEGGIKLIDNLNFITWNYDMQLQLAYQKFFNESIELAKINDYLPFDPINDTLRRKLKICHLNGFCGYMKTRSEKDIFFIDRLLPVKNISQLKEAFQSKANEIYPEKPEPVYSLNFAWEKDIILKDRIFERAIEIAKETRTLVIIGYSFPIFNRKIDSLIFKTMIESNNLKKIYYQSLDANEKFLRDTFEIVGRNHENSDYTIKIEVVKDPENMKQFVIPHT
jgi:hypothetical protein